MTHFDNIEKFPDRSSVNDQAAAWITLSDRRELTSEEQAEFNVWLARSPQHAEAFARMTKHWDAFDALAGLKLPVEVDDAVARDETGPSISGRRASWGALAACLAIILFGVMAWVFQPVSPVTTKQALHTAIGEQKTVTLADGSKLTLDTNSSVEVRFTPAQRDITLQQGEVYIEVAHDRNRPLFVHAGSSAVRAVGTAFSVSLHEAIVKVTVTEGRVQLLGPDVQSSQQVVDGSSQPHSVSLGEVGARHEAQFSPQGVTVKPLSAEEVSMKLAWHRGFLAFAGDPLAQALKEISRYTDITIEITDPELEQLPVGGYFKVGEVDEFLLALNTMFGIKVEHIDAHHVRLSRAS